MKTTRDKPGRNRLAREQFARLVSDPEGVLDVARAALLIAAEDAGHVDIEADVAALVVMSREVSARLPTGGGLTEQLTVLADYLHGEMGFCGDEKTYYDPRNSFLSEVLRRKKGIPITLSVVYVTVGRGAGLHLTGISFPAHFLVGAYATADTRGVPEMFIDPFRPRELMRRDDCRALFTRLGGSAHAFRETMLHAATPRQILTRILTNLKLIYAQTQQPEKAIAAIDRILLLNPDAITEYRDRGALHMHLDLYSLALEDFEHYLGEEPTAEERGAIEQAVATLRERIAMLH